MGPGALAPYLAQVSFREPVVAAPGSAVWRGPYAFPLALALEGASSPPGAADLLRSVPGRLPGRQDTQEPVQGVSAEEVFGSQHEQRW